MLVVFNFNFAIFQELHLVQPLFSPFLPSVGSTILIAKLCFINLPLLKRLFQPIFMLIWLKNHLFLLGGLQLPLLDFTALLPCLLPSIQVLLFNFISQLLFPKVLLILQPSILQFGLKPLPPSLQYSFFFLQVRSSWLMLLLALYFFLPKPQLRPLVFVVRCSPRLLPTAFISLPELREVPLIFVFIPLTFLGERFFIPPWLLSQLKSLPFFSISLLPSFIVLVL